APGITRSTAPNALQNAPVSTIGNMVSNNNSNPTSMVPSTDEAISVDGYPIQFIWPNNPAGSSLCGSPWPEVQIPGNAKNGSCPFNVPCDNPTNRDANIPSGGDPVKFMQLRWTIIRNAAGDASSNISLTRVNDLMTELNNDCASWKLEFCLDVVNFVNDGTHYNFDGSDEAAMKSAYGANFTNVINIYVVNNITNPSAGGYAYFPYSGYGGYNYRGGVLMSKNNSSLGTHTLAHELGHTFGLHHTFHGVDEVGVCSSCYEAVGAADGSPASGDDHGDYCSDTNPHETNSYSCNANPGGSNVCDSDPWANVPVNNHMSYSFCSSQFTPQQAGRMHCMIDTYVPQWVVNGSVTCGSLPPVANFTGSPTLWPAPSTVSFTNLTAGKSTVTAWSWNFDVQNVGGVTPATSILQDPTTVLYANPGLYEVRLIATNPNGIDTLVRTDYIEVVGPVGDCDTLDFQWLNPTPTVSYLQYGPGDYAVGVPCATFNTSATDPLGMYERFQTPTPGSTVVGGVRMALGFLADANDDMKIDISIYADDGTGAPNLSTGYLGGVTGLSPTTDLNVPNGFFYGWRNWAFDPPVLITSSKFHIGIEINPGSAADTMILICSGAGQGENDTSNYVNTTGIGLLSYLVDVGEDRDLAIIPFLGGYGPDTRITTYSQNVGCDTTTVVFFDTTWYAPGISWQFDFASDGSSFTDTVDPIALAKTYTSPGTETVTVSVVDACGKGGTRTYMIEYFFNETPDGDFTKDLSNPICLPPPTSNCATFTATPADQFAYTWNFGDGTTFTDTSDVLQYCFSAPGSYYVDLDVTGYVGEPTDTLFYEDFSSGIGSFNTFDVDGGSPVVNPPFDGTNSTAWVGNSSSGPGLAISTSWYNPAATADDWMISSAIALNSSSTLRWRAVAYSSGYPDGYEVWISTTTQTVAGCLAGTLLYSTAAENPYYSPRTIDLALAGFQNQTVYIGFRNISNDMYILGIDNVLVSFSGAGCVSEVQKLDYVDIIDCNTTPPTAAMITPSPTSGCDSATVTFIDNSTNSPTSWVWDFNDGNFSIIQNPPPHTYTSPGTYNVQLIVENAGGVDTAFYTINIYTTPAMPTAGTNATYCEGDAIANLTASGSSIEWFSDPGLTTLLGTGSPFTPTVSVGTNTYYVTETTNGCQSPANSVVLTVNQAATAAAGSNASICSGSTHTLSGAIGGSAGSSTWSTSGSGGFNNASSLTATYTPSAGDITAGTVTLKLTTDDPDAGGPCEAAKDSIVLTINTTPTASISASSNISCLNGNDGSATGSGSGGTGPYTYNWNDPSSQTSAMATGLLAGSFTVTVSDANGCFSTAGVTLTEPGTAVSAVTGTVDASCGNPDGKAYVTASGGTGPYTYVWDDPGTQTTDTAFNLLANNYNVTVTDANGCTELGTASVSDVGAPSASISGVVHVTCNGGSDGEATVSATGGATPYTYGWSTGGTGTTETGMSAGTHSATVTDNVGCVGSVNVTITEPPAIVIGTQNPVDITCNGLTDGSITLIASGMSTFNYSIDSGSTYPNTTGLFTGLSAGTYVVFVQDLSGCTQIGMTLTINEPSAINITTQTATNITCTGDDDGTILIQATGGTGTLMFSIDSGATVTDTTGSFGSLTPGTYGVYVEDANGCSASGSNLVIDEPTAVSIDSETVTNITCNGDGNGTITITASGGTGVLNYSINGGSTFSTSGTFSSQPAGTNYAVAVEDANGCSVTGSTLTITEPAVLVLNTASVDASCGQSDGQVSVSPMGGTGAYTYVWDDPGTSVTDTVTGLAAATYGVTVTDANGCIATSSSTVSNPGSGTPNTTVDNDATCNGGCDGQATVAMTNGTTPFTYSWDDPGSQTVASAAGLCAGTYSVTITDAASCVVTDSVTISEPTAIVPFITIMDTELGTCLGSATASATGGNGPYTYLWSDAQTGPIASNLCPGPIGLTVTDASGCTVSTTDTVGSFTGILDQGTDG
ncbi:MAG TPA: PKD domain-containing protein, partial [Flavobacteriales bacterium]|nr:PKD domain-containing protein [Flavobacteriales bacterium]